jgi:hydroxyacylglutathione hydrolase
MIRNGTAAPVPAGFTRIPLGFVNAYLAKTSEGFVLVDTGVPDSWDRLSTCLAAAGCTKENLKLVVLTHGDLDHVGCARRLWKEWGVPIAAHRGDLALISTGEGPKRRGTSFLIRAGMKLRPFRKPDLEAADSPYFTPDLFLEDGDSLLPYGWDARIVHGPGHTAGSIAILTADGDLIVGDTASNMTHPGPGMLAEDFDEYNRTLAAFRLLPVHTVHPGHGGPFPFDKLPHRV